MYPLDLEHHQHQRQAWLRGGAAVVNGDAECHVPCALPCPKAYHHGPMARPKRPITPPVTQVAEAPSAASSTLLQARWLAGHYLGLD
jgi:hypothetical protein